MGLITAFSYSYVCAIMLYLYLSFNAHSPTLLLKWKVCVFVHERDVYAWHTCKGQRTTWWSLFFPSTFSRVPRIRFRLVRQVLLLVNSYCQPSPPPLLLVSFLLQIISFLFSSDTIFSNGYFPSHRVHGYQHIGPEGWLVLHFPERRNTKWFPNYWSNFSGILISGREWHS